MSGKTPLEAQAVALISSTAFVVALLGSCLRHRQWARDRVLRMAEPEITRSTACTRPGFHDVQGRVPTGATTSGRKSAMDGFEGDGQAAGGSTAGLDGWGGLAATLQPPPAEGEPSLREGGSSPEGEPSPMPLLEAAGLAAVPVDASTLATLVGEEVASVLEAAQVAAAEIRSKAEDLAADAQRRISEMQSALAQMSAEMTDLMMRTAERVPFAPGPERTGASATPVDEAIVIEHRSSTGTPTTDSDPDVDDRPGDYQRWLQRMGELSSQKPR